MSQKLKTEDIKFKLNASLTVIQIYEDLVNSFVLVSKYFECNSIQRYINLYFD